MKSYRLNVDTVFDGDDNAPSIAAFVDQFGEVLYAGKGSPPMMLKQLNIGPDFPLRCLVGIPEEDFTTPRRVLAEAYCQHITGADVSDIWTTDRKWLPINPTREIAPLERCVFDAEFALTLGLSRARWETDILLSTGALSRQQSREGSFNLNARFLLALAVYGFSDPWQFFTAIK